MKERIQARPYKEHDVWPSERVWKPFSRSPHRAPVSPRKVSILVFATFVICAPLLLPSLAWKTFLSVARSNRSRSFFLHPETPEQMHPTRVVFPLLRNASISLRELCAYPCSTSAARWLSRRLLIVKSAMLIECFRTNRCSANDR